MSTARPPSLAARVFDAFGRFLNFEARNQHRPPDRCRHSSANRPLADSHQHLQHAPLASLLDVGAWLCSR
jgi:hypothetical protein